MKQNPSANPDIIPDGLPDHLPEGEQLVWQGKPDWQNLAINAFHVRKVAVYFGVVIIAQAALHLARGASWATALDAVPVLIGLALAACAILAALAYASAKTTRYTLTTKRALMKVGIALPVNINIPFRHVDGVSFAVTSGTSGNIVFKTGGEVRLAYLLLWPHTKPWHIAKPQPTFRDVPDVEAVANRLALVLGGRRPVVETKTHEQPHGLMIAAE